MRMDNLDIELIDIMETITYTLSDSFINNWKNKYSERLLKLFQMSILKSLKEQKPLKMNKLFKYLSKDSGYNPDIVEDFFLDIEYDIYNPVISGELKEAREELDGIQGRSKSALSKR